jgi:glycosyltransferase involved in cell wall biosynthesis
MAGCAAVVVPSVASEALPLVVLEAFSWGLPAIAYDIPGVRDVITEGRNGFLVRRADGVDGLERALDRLLGDPAGCVRLGATARADYDAGHRFEMMIDKTIALLEQTAGKAAARRAG